MEKVLIWPEQYPLLLKGLIERNGAYILDALEAWPQCGTNEEDGVSSSVLPPVYYLIWFAPREPFEQCTFQHISDFNDQAQHYIIEARKYFQENDYTNEQISQMLIECLSEYADLNAQIAFDSPLSLPSLLYQQRFFTLLEALLERGAKLCSEDVLTLWQEVDFRPKFATYLPECIEDINDSLEQAKNELVQGRDFFTLVQTISGDADTSELLEQALLAHLQSEHAKQSMAMRFTDQGAKGTLSNEQGQTALMLAAKNGFVTVVEELIKHADIDAQDQQKKNALHYAVDGNNQTCMALLLKNGANFKAKNEQGLSCYRYAVEQNRKELVKSLERDFGIEELSQKEQYARIVKVHALHAVVLLLLPLQLFFFFDKEIDYKSELTLILTILSLVAFFFAASLKRCALYPDLKHPFTLSLLRGISLLSLIGQLGLLAIVALTFLSQLS